MGVKPFCPNQTWQSGETIIQWLNWEVVMICLLRHVKVRSQVTRKWGLWSSKRPHLDSIATRRKQWPNTREWNEDCPDVDLLLPQQYAPLLTMQCPIMYTIQCHRWRLQTSAKPPNLKAPQGSTIASFLNHANVNSIQWLQAIFLQYWHPYLPNWHWLDIELRLQLLDRWRYTSALEQG